MESIAISLFFPENCYIRGLNRLIAMKSIFNEADKNEILQRIEKLNPESKALWGKMNVAQMLAHTTLAARFPTGEVKSKNSPVQFIGQLFKKQFLGEKNMPFRRNSPTTPEIKVVDPRDFQQEKANLIQQINRLFEMGEKGATAPKHAFFGKMTPAEWGIINYKHADHHLSQFGV